MVGDIVYFGDLQSRTTTGLGARTGRKVFRFGRGGFNPVVSDGRNLYVVGYASLARSSRRRLPHADARLGEVALELGHRVLAVVEDRGEQDGVGAGAEGVDEVARAPRRRPRR